MSKDVKRLTIVAGLFYLIPVSLIIVEIILSRNVETAKAYCFSGDCDGSNTPLLSMSLMEYVFWVTIAIGLALTFATFRIHRSEVK